MFHLGIFALFVFLESIKRDQTPLVLLKLLELRENFELTQITCSYSSQSGWTTIFKIDKIDIHKKKMQSLAHFYDHDESKEHLWKNLQCFKVSRIVSELMF